MWINFDREVVDRLHYKLIELTGGAQGVLNSGNIDAALNSPRASFGGEDLYPTDLHKCCKLYHALVVNHGYVDGNKRIGLYMFLLSLDNCGFSYSRFSGQFVESLTVQIASGNLSVDQVYEIVSEKLK